MSIAKFRFRLEPALKQRAEKEVAAEQALALARQEYNLHLTSLENTRERLEASMQAVPKNRPNFFELYQLSFYGAALKEKINDQKKNVDQAGLIVSHKRDEAVQARQGRQALERLKEKQFDNYKQDLAEKEQKEADELSRNVYQRNLSELNLLSSVSSLI